MPTSFQTFATLAVSLLLSACAAPIAEQRQAGFLSDYSKLIPAERSAYHRTDARITSYMQIIIEDPVFLIDEPGDASAAMFEQDELAKLSEYVRERLGKALTRDGRFEIVDDEGPGVARLRVAFTALDASRGILNASLYTRVTGAGLGGAALESEVVDSLTGEQLSATVQWGNDGRFFRAGFTKLGGAKLQVNRWAKGLVRRIGGVDQDVAETQTVT